MRQPIAAMPLKERAETVEATTLSLRQKTNEVDMAKQGRPKSATTSVVISIRVDEGVLEEIDRLMNFRFRAPIGRETYLRMILYGDEPPVSPAVERDNLVRVDFRLPSPSVAELAKRVGDGNRSEHIRRILMGLEECLSPLPDEYDK